LDGNFRGLTLLPCLPLLPVCLCLVCLPLLPPPLLPPPLLLLKPAAAPGATVCRKKKKKHKKQKEHGGGGAMADGAAMLAAQPTTAPGSGTLLTSGTSVMGKGTKFTEEVHAGDTITVTNESTLVEETRRVTMVLGPTAMALSAPFASDVVTNSDFTVTSMPRSDDGKPQQAGRRVKDSGARELVWREKAGFGYKIHRDKIKKTSTQDLLDMRCKKKADRMCM
jgi:hypothetical protein